MVLRRQILWLALLAFLAPALLLGQSVNFSISSREITTDDALTLKVTVEGGSRMGSPVFPRIEGMANYGTSQQMNSINGRMSSSFSSNYQAQQPGTYTVPSFSIKVDGQTFSSPSWQVKVSKGSGKPRQQASQGLPGGSAMPKTMDDLFEQMSRSLNPRDLQFKEVDADYFLSVEASKTTAYPGEQLLGEVVLYVNERDFAQGKISYDGLGIQQMAGRLKNTGFWQEMLPSITVSGKRVNLGGKTYVAISLYKTFLYPLASGKISFDKVYLDAKKLKVATNGRDIFGRAITQYDPIKIYARKQEITVEPLPATSLPHSGVAGEFTMSGSLSEDTLSTGDMTELKLVLSGRGNVAMLDAPIVRWPSGVEVYDPTSSYESTISDVEVKGMKTFTWPVMATQPGDRMIGPATLYFFNASKLAYDSVVVPPFRIHAEGEDLLNARMKSKENDELYTAALARADADLRGNRGSWTGWLMLVCLLPLAAIGTWRVLLSRKKKVKDPSIEFKPVPQEPSFWES